MIKKNNSPLVGMFYLICYTVIPDRYACLSSSFHRLYQNMIKCCGTARHPSSPYALFQPSALSSPYKEQGENSRAETRKLRHAIYSLLGSNRVS